MTHNISIATAVDVSYFGDDVKYIICIFTQGNYHLGLLSQLVRKQFFGLFVVNLFGNSPMATECSCSFSSVEHRMTMLLFRTVFITLLSCITRKTRNS